MGKKYKLLAISVWVWNAFLCFIKIKKGVCVQATHSSFKEFYTELPEGKLLSIWFKELFLILGK